MPEIYLPSIGETVQVQERMTMGILTTYRPFMGGVVTTTKPPIEEVPSVYDTPIYHDAIGPWRKPLRVRRLDDGGPADERYPDGYLICKVGKPHAWRAVIAEVGTDGGLYEDGKLSKWHDITDKIFAWCELQPE